MQIRILFSAFSSLLQLLPNIPWNIRDPRIVDLGFDTSTSSSAHYNLNDQRPHVVNIVFRWFCSFIPCSLTAKTSETICHRNSICMPLLHLTIIPLKTRDHMPIRILVSTLLCLHLLLWRCGFQCKDILGTLLSSSRSVCPVKYQHLFFTSLFTGMCWRFFLLLKTQHKWFWHLR